MSGSKTLRTILIIIAILAPVLCILGVMILRTSVAGAAFASQSMMEIFADGTAESLAKHCTPEFMAGKDPESFREDFALMREELGRLENTETIGVLVSFTNGVRRCRIRMNCKFEKADREAELIVIQRDGVWAIDNITIQGRKQKSE